MNTQQLTRLAVVLLVAVGLAACDKPGPAESAGKSIDKTADEVGKKLSDGASKTGVVIDDSEITTKVKAALFAEPGLDSLKITVDTVKGVVTLSGSVDTPALNDKAGALATATAGVTKVINQLTTVSGK